MISKNDYLPLLVKMGLSERDVYKHNLSEYMSRSCPLSESNYNDKVFDEGVKLASALRSSREVIPLLYRPRMKVLERCIRLNKMLFQARDYLQMTGGSVVDQRLHAVTDDNKVLKVERSDQSTNVIKGEKVFNDNKAIHSERVVKPLSSPSPSSRIRPQHISDYLHLLPAHIQSEHKSLQDLYNEMSYAHHQLEMLVLENPTSSKTERVKFAQYVCRKEERILNFWKRVDAYWERSQGLDVSDDTISELEKEASELLLSDNATPPTRLLGSYCKAEIDKMPDGELKDNAKKARILRNQKYLRRTDVQRVDVESYKVAVEELHAWGIWITQLQADSCLAVGYEVPSEYISPSAEERKKEAQSKYEAKRKQQRQERSAEIKKMRAEIKADNPFIEPGFNFID